MGGIVPVRFYLTFFEREFKAQLKFKRDPNSFEQKRRSSRFSYNNLQSIIRMWITARVEWHDIA